MTGSTATSASPPVWLVLTCAASLAVPFGLDAQEAQQEDFIELAAVVGLGFEHRDGRSGRYYFIETMGGGGGWLDYDGDGDLDIYLVNGAGTPGSALATPPTNALYENRDGRFVDVAQEIGVADESYGMGFCAGDYDGDGRPDLMVTNFGANRLYRNLGPVDGRVRFEDRAAEAGVDEQGWSASCAFGDLDADGDLDLYVTHYVDFEIGEGPSCEDRARGLRYHCHPSHFRGVTDSLWINWGDGTFRSEGRKRGIATGATERGLGVVMSDLDADGDLDIYVTNDGSANRYYQNRGDGTFEDLSLLSGTALGASGAQQAGMGIATGDADGDGRFDLAVTNFSLEPNNFYLNQGDGLFEERARASGIAELSFRDLGWGIAFLDYDLDGDLDLATANGHVMDNVASFVPGIAYAQPNRLLANDGRGHFTDVSARSGAAWRTAKPSRGLAVGDYDNDGRPDLLITTQNGAVDLLANRTRTGHAWLGIVLEGAPGNALAIGARVELVAGDRQQVREVRSGGGVLTQSDLRLLFGLGDHSGEVTATIRWPDGHRQVASTDQLDRYWTISYRAGDARPLSPRAVTTRR